MDTTSRQTHWDMVYASKGETEVSWFEESPALSLDLIKHANAVATSAIIDIGGGASRLVDDLTARGFMNVTVLDLSEKALNIARTRLGENADRVRWIVADVTTWEPSELYDIWHDRAAFHFLTAAADRAAYVSRLSRAVKPGGYAIIGTFAPDGPDKCSGLPILRYDTQALGRALGGAFELVSSLTHSHMTPWGAEQRFQFGLFQRGS